jgi:hypothetical protein
MVGFKVGDSVGAGVGVWVMRRQRNRISGLSTYESDSKSNSDQLPTSSAGLAALCLFPAINKYGPWFKAAEQTQQL